MPLSILMNNEGRPRFDMLCTSSDFTAAMVFGCQQQPVWDVYNVIMLSWTRFLGGKYSSRSSVAADPKMEKNLNFPLNATASSKNLVSPGCLMNNSLGICNHRTLFQEITGTLSYGTMVHVRR